MTRSNPVSAHSPEDRLLASLAHLSALVPMLGLLIPIVIWVVQRTKSPYLAFQSLQAVIFQLLSFVILILSYVCQFSSILSTVLSLPFQGSSSPLSGIMNIILVAATLIVNLISVIACLIYMVSFVYAITAAVLVFKGRDFHYFIIGHQIEKLGGKNNSGEPLSANG